MNFLVTLTKSYAGPLYILVLACSPLKRVMYMVNVSDMFRNIRLKFQTRCIWLPLNFPFGREYIILNKKQFYSPMKRKIFRSFV